MKNEFFNMTIDINNPEEQHDRFYKLWNNHKGLTVRHYTTNANDIECFEEIESEAYIAYHTLFGDISCIADEYQTSAKAKSKWVNEIFKQTKKYNKYNRDVSNKKKSQRTLKYEYNLIADYLVNNVMYTPEDDIVANLDSQMLSGVFTLK